MSFKKVLVALDGSDSSEEALNLAAGIAIDFRTDVVDDDFGTALGQQQGVFAPDTLGGAGDDGDAVFA